MTIGVEDSFEVTLPLHDHPLTELVAIDLVRIRNAGMTPLRSTCVIRDTFDSSDGGRATISAYRMPKTPAVPLRSQTPSER